MIEQEMVVIKAKDLEDYKAKHEAESPLPEVHFFSAKIAPDAFYKEKIEALQKENARLRTENKQLQTMVEELQGERNYYKDLQDSTRMKIEDKFDRKMKEYQERIAKLEKAVIEAVVK